MASTNTVICGVCESQHTTTNADYWCPECDEGLCSQCLKHHSASKSSRNHEVISVDNYKQLPPSITNISQHCQQHDRKFQNYCPQHESVCCPLCIQSNHAECVGILSLENVIQTAKTSVLLESLDQNLKDIKINIERVVKDRKQNVIEIQKQGQKFHDEIKQVRKNINEHLDNLEQQILQDLYAAETKVKSQTEDLLGKLDDNAENVNSMENNILTIKDNASDLQTFLWSKMIESEIKKIEIFMQSLYDDESLWKMDINCKIEDKITELMSNVTSLGTISIGLSSPLVEAQIGKATQAQTMSLEHVSSKTIDDITMTFQGKFTGYFYAIVCSFFSTGDIVLIELGYNRLMILKEDGTFKSRIPLSTHTPVDCACVDDKTVAVTFAESKQLQIINILTKSIEHKISTNDDCYGLCYTDGYLLYCEYGTGIQKVDMSSVHKRPHLFVKDDTLSLWCYVATFKDKIFYTNSLKSTLTCCSLTGKMIWEYKDQSVRSSKGISVDKDSNVYIASSDNDSIIVLSSDGKHARKLLGSDDGISRPFGLVVDLKNGKLIVLDNNGVLLYGIQF